MLGQQEDQLQRRAVPALAHIDGQSKEFRMCRVDDFRVFPLYVLVRLPEAGPVYRRTPRVRGTCTGKRGADRGVTEDHPP